MTVTLVLRWLPPRCERLLRELVVRLFPPREAVERWLRRDEPERLEREVERAVDRVRLLLDRELVPVRRERLLKVRRRRDCEPPRLADADRDEVERERLPLDRLPERVPERLPERLLPVLLERERLRLPPDELFRAVVRAREPELLRERLPRELRGDVPRCERPWDRCAESRLTSLLKLLFCPPEVWSCTSNASPLSSNF